MLTLFNMHFHNIVIIVPVVKEERKDRHLDIYVSEVHNNFTLIKSKVLSLLPDIKRRASILILCINCIQPPPPHT